MDFGNLVEVLMFLAAGFSGLVLIAFAQERHRSPRLGYVLSASAMLALAFVAARPVSPAKVAAAASCRSEALAGAVPRSEPKRPRPSSDAEVAGSLELLNLTVQDLVRENRKLLTELRAE